MYSEFKGEKISVVVSSRGENLLEYVGTLVQETEYSIILTNVDISYLMLSYQKGFFGGNINKYKENLSKVIINKKYIISCDSI